MSILVLFSIGLDLMVNNLAKQVVCYGVMIRECDDPRTLPSSHWWKYSHIEAEKLIN